MTAYPPKDELKDFAFWMSIREVILNVVHLIERDKLGMSVTTSDMCAWYRRNCRSRN